MHTETLIIKTRNTGNREEIILGKLSIDNYYLETDSQRVYYDHYPTKEEVAEFANLAICEDEWYLYMIEV